MPLPGRLEFSRRLVKRFMKQPAVLRRNRVVVWQGNIRLVMGSDNPVLQQIMQQGTGALPWEISFPYDIDVRNGDDVVLTDEEFTPLSPPQVFEVSGDGGPYTDQAVRIAIAFETGIM